MIRPGIRKLLRLPRAGKHGAEQDLDREIQLHLQLRIEQLEKQGRTAEEARREALRRFGPPEQKRSLRRAALRRERRLRVIDRLDGIRQDIRYSIRSLIKTPGVSAVIVLTLALGIGLCTSLYSVVRGVILDPVPFPEAHELLSIGLAGEGPASVPVYRSYEQWAPAVSSVVDLEGYALGPRRIEYNRGIAEGFSIRVTGGFFGLLGARPQLGRTLVPSDFAVGSEPVAIVSDRVWQSLLGSDPAAIGRQIEIGGEAYSLVGVMQPGHEFPAPVDVWTPLIPTPEELEALQITAIGRLAADATPERARVALQAVQQAELVDAQPEALAPRIEILPLTGRQNEAVGLISILLAISVGSILLIGVANAAGLILTRALSRAHEIAIRSSLGASRARIAVMLLLEALLLAIAAAATGLVIAHLAVTGFQLLMPDSVTRQILGWEQLGVDIHVFGVAIGVALVAGVICGLVPVIGTARADVTLALQQSSSATTAGPRGRRMLRTLVVGEVAISVVLLLCAALLSRSLYELVRHDPGFDPDGIAAVRWSLPDEDDPDPRALLRLQEDLLSRAEGAPGVASAVLASELPSTKAGFGAARNYQILDAPPAGGRGRASWRAVSPGYLEALRTPLLQGRVFEPSDGAEAPRVAIVSESLARAVEGGRESVLGHQIEVGDQNWSVIGVAGEVQGFGETPSAAPTIYVPLAQSPTGSGYVLVGLEAPLGTVAHTLADQILRADPALALGETQTLQDLLDQQIADKRIVASLVGAYASTALVITLISLYAIMAHLVVRHRREHGIRAALGASPGQIVRGATRRALTAALIGTLIGTAVAVGIARVIGSLLYGIRPLEPSVFGLVPLLLLATFALVVYLPARAAAKADPMAALRV